MAEIKCPMCGKPNPAELAVCQYCEARLKPLTDELSRSQPPIHPGEEPKDMDTGQLERTLPGWLREIRQQARETGDQGSGKQPRQPETGQPADQAEFLAGLRSQSKGKEEIPDWLGDLRSEGGQVGFEETAAEEDDIAALRSMLGDETPPSQVSKPGAISGWADEHKVGQAEASAEEPPHGEPESFPSSSDFHWEADFGTESDQVGESREETPFDSELPAWLKDTETPQADETGNALPAWLGAEAPADTGGESKAFSDQDELPSWLQEKEEPFQEATGNGLPAWLASLDKEGESGEILPSQDTEQPGVKSTTDWLASFDKEKMDAGARQSADEAIKSTTDWLASLDDDTVEAGAPQESAQPVSESDLPGWLAALGEESNETMPQEETRTYGAGEKPDWLASFSEQSQAIEAGPSPGDEPAEPAQPASQDELPDWLAAISKETDETEQPAEELDFSSFASDRTGDRPGATSAFVDDEGKPIAKEDVEAIFSMDVPDWLSDTEATSELEPAPPAGEEEADELRPAELPSWVQAMRPVESVISEAEGATTEAQPVEERGPLAGLRGVLPATAGIGPFSKPKGYSFKLQVSEDQRSSAAMLESILAEEVTPKPAIAQKVVLTQRILRWVIAALLLLVVGLTVYFSPQISPVPARVPLETSAAWDTIRDTLPANAPVLLVFDYEAARAGELEAAAAPLIDQMLTLKTPRLSLVSSTPVGSGLAERFVSILQSGREPNSFARNEHFANLGYLPGGPAGVQAFSGNPRTTKPLTTSGEAAWSTPVLQDVENLSQFQAIFLLTDDLETARIWIEQTEGQRGEARFLVISSAQSAPMILPYERSGQIDGMVAGLEGGAPIEQANSGRPGMARRYWDAFGFGLLTAALMIMIGSLWSLIAGWRTLRKEQGEG